MGKNSKKKQAVTIKTTAAPQTTIKPAMLWLAPAVIAAITFVAFSPCLKAAFTNLDDDSYLTSIQMLLASASPLKAIFQTPVCANYHPLTVLTLAANYSFSKMNPASYHIINLAIHILNTSLVFFFIYRLTSRSFLKAVFVSLFFAIHPMHVESVAWVSERKDVLYVFFFLAGLIAWQQYRKQKKAYWYLATLLLFILSCLSKGMAVVFPLILLLLDYWEKRKPEGAVIIEKIPFFIVSMALGVVAFLIQQQSEALSLMHSFTLLQKIIYPAYGMLMYLVKFIFPFNLAVFYPYPNAEDIPPIYYLSPLIIAGLIAYVFYNRKQKRFMVFGLLFFFISIVLVLKVVSVGATIYSDRYSYLSYIGLLFIASNVVSDLWDRSKDSRPARWLLTAVLALITFSFSYATYQRTLVWENSGTLWTDEIEKYPTGLGIGYQYRGNYYADQHMPEKAIADYNQVEPNANLNANSAANRGVVFSFYLHRGEAYAETGQLEQAMKDINKAISFNPASAEAFNDRGRIYAMTGKSDSALSNFMKALAVDSSYNGVYFNLGIYYDMNRMYDKAIASYNKYISVDSSDGNVFMDRAIAFDHLQQFQNAEKDFNKAVSLLPNLPGSYINRGSYFESVNENEQALSDYSRAIEIKPDADTYNLQGVVLRKLKRYKESIASFTKAIDLKPDVRLYRYNLSLSIRADSVNTMAKQPGL